MSSVDYLREFVNERLTAAAEEIFRVFKNPNVIVQYEEEIDRLLDIAWKPDKKLHRIELPQQHVCKEEEVLSDQQSATTMSSVEYLREFINERLTAAAEEIFGVFNKTIVQYEEQIDRQHKLLDIVWKPDIKLHRIELPQQHVCKEEEVLADQQLCIQERNSSLDQEDPEPPQIKEEQEEEQLVLEQEIDAFIWYPSDEESNHSEDQTLSFNPEDTLGVANKESEGNIPVIISVVPEAHGDHQLHSHSRHEADRQKSHNVNNPNSSELHRDTQTGKKSLTCDICGKDFQCQSLLQRHLTTHTGEKPYFCKICGKDFSKNSRLIRHMRIHTGEKLYMCKTCGKGFRDNCDLKTHMRTHTGEKPYLCKTCGKDFTTISLLKIHMRTHTGEKPYSCETCGKAFSRSGNLKVHMRAHTGEKPYSCKTCRKDFITAGALKIHMRTHTGERPYSCEICGKDFAYSDNLTVHMRSHTGEKPYYCELCGKHFAHGWNFKIHMKTHTGENHNLAKHEEELSDSEVN